MAGTRKYGAKIAIGAGPTEVGGLKGISFSGRNGEVIEVTQHRTGADALKNFREKMGGLVDSGQVTVTANYIKNDAGQEAARDGIGTELAFTVTYSDGATVAGSGIVSEASPAEADDTEGNMSFSFTLDITGKLTFVEA